MARRTLASDVGLEGTALHAGVRSKVRIQSAAPGTGIVFRRSDIPGSAPIRALWSNVVETRLGTVIAAADGTNIGVVEHLMSALAGADIDDCIIDVEGPEPPILGGDALSFLQPVLDAGVVEQGGDRPVLVVRDVVETSDKNASCRLVPSAEPEFRFEIDFESPAIGRQEYEFRFSPAAYRKEIAPARTFGFYEEAEMLRAAGLARGANLTNTLVIDGEKLMNPELQRFPDEFVRHKILDAIGDMKLAGTPIRGRFEGSRSSHALNNALLRALFANPANYEISP
jgi:UDP-3-O-[3-hydroxymyristoyl] N-acetylglucosamine deacetylase